MKLSSIEEHVLAELPKGYQLLFLTRTGSQLYGTATPDSDEDYMGIFVPSREDLFLNRASSQMNLGLKQGGKDEKNQKGDVDCTLYSVQNFFRLLQKADSNMISLLFAHTNPDAVIYQAPLMEKWDRTRLVSRNLSGMAGYVRSQMFKYSMKGVRYSVASNLLQILSKAAKQNDARKLLGEVRDIPQLVADEVEYWSHREDVTGLVKIVEDNTATYLYVLGKMYNLKDTVGKCIVSLEQQVNQYGARARGAATTDFSDYKAMYHAVRVGDEILELHETGKLKYPNRYRDAYMDIRLGRVTLDAAAKMMEDNQHEIDEYYDYVKPSKLPEKFDSKYADQLVLQLYRKE